MFRVFSQVGEKISKLLGERVDYGVSHKDTSKNSPSRDSLNQYFRQFYLSDLLPYEAYDSSKGFFYNGNSIGFVFETSPLVGCSEEMQREISGLFQHTLVEGSSIQFMMWADPHVGSILEPWRRARELASCEIFKTLAEKRTQFLASQVFDSPHNLPLRNFRCIVSYSQKLESDLKEALRALGPLEEQRLLQTKSQIETALKTLGMPVISWDAVSLLSTLDGIINYRRETETQFLKWNPYDALKLQIPSNTSYQIEKNGICVNEGESVIRTYSVRREPDQWSLHAMGELIGDPLRDLLQIPCPFVIHYGIHVPFQDKTKTRVQSRESWVENQARSKIGSRIPILQKQSRELDFVRHQLSKGERFVQTSFTVTLFSDVRGLSHADQVLTNLFRSKRWQLQFSPYIQLPLFLSTLPMSWGFGLHKDLFFLQGLKTTLSTESANLLPLQGEWKGTCSASGNGMILAGRRGQILTWSPFENKTGNYNVAVVGKSGSGKSVFMQELVASTLGTGGQVFVLDVGRSFERTAKLLGGSYMEFTAHTSLSINPFSAIPMDNASESADALSMLKPIISLMAAPRDGTNDLENAFIEQALLHAWEELRSEASITDVANFLNMHEDSAARKLGQKLFPYTRSGIYGRFFDGPANVDLSNSLVVIELEELKERKDLQEVIVQMMIMQITNRLYLGDRKTPSHVVLDEAWDMLRGKQSGVFIETAARRLRKYRGSLVVGTQSVNDFYATPAAQAAFENSDWMCFLAQKPESIKQLKESKRLALDPAMETQLTSLKTQQGQYAEIMITGPHGYAVGRLLLDPFSRILYSTKPEEFAAVQNLLGKGFSLAQAIETIAGEKR